VVRVAGSLVTWLFVFLAASSWADTAGSPSETTDTIPPAVTDGAAAPAAPAPIEPAPAETAAPEEEFLPHDIDERSLERRWSEAVDSVSGKIASGERVPEDADALFVELVNDLRRELRVLRADIREDRRATTRVIGEYERARELYDTRIRLLGLTTDKFRKLVTGAGPEGVSELRLESRYLATQLLYQTFRIPQDVAQRTADARIAPLPAIFATLELLVAIGVFVAWRRWAKRELPGIQSRLRWARLRDPTFGRMERFVGFLRRVRHPVEWLLLFSVAFRVLEFGHAADLEGVLWIVIWWFLVAWLAVCAGQAVLARRLGTSDEDLEHLRARSLRLVAAWLLVIGMGLNVAEDVVGQGTLYAWIWRTFVVLTIPTVVILIAWWRSRIFDALDQEAERSTFAAGLLRNRTGVGGFIGATMGVVYLMAVRTFARALREMENFEGGRRTLSALTQFEMVVAPLSAPQSDEPEVAITEDLRERIINAEVADIEGVGVSVVDAISARVGTRHAAVAIVGERGAGKTSILRQVQAKHDGKIRVLRCPVGGFAAFHALLAETVGVREEELTPEVAQAWIEETGIEVFVVDGFHRMVKPSMGGGSELDELLPFLLAAFSKVS